MKTLLKTTTEHVPTGRQGDVQIFALKELPPNAVAVEVKDNCVAYGETSGHSHMLLEAPTQPTFAEGSPIGLPYDAEVLKVAQEGVKFYRVEGSNSTFFEVLPGKNICLGHVKLGLENYGKGLQAIPQELRRADHSAMPLAPGIYEAHGQEVQDLWSGLMTRSRD